MNTSSPQNSQQYQGFGALCLLALCTLLVACGSDTVQPAAHAHGASYPSTSQVQGAGSTFDAPLFSNMFAVYAKVPFFSGG
jgi:phosphate transport system substrate-binding protein